jgi:hypothetical protein
MQELSNSFKRPNLRIMGIKEGGTVQIKGTCNVFIKMITENFPNLKKEMHIQVQEAPRAPNTLDQNRAFPWHIIAKIISTENK